LKSEFANFPKFLFSTHKLTTFIVSQHPADQDIH
jgi:hypothetical protein